MNQSNRVVTKFPQSPRVHCVSANPSANLVSESDASVAGTLSERAAQGNLSQFNSLDLALPWFVARCSIQLGYGRAVVELMTYINRICPHGVPVVSHQSYGNLYGPLFPVQDDDGTKDG
jgi:hypothetical protein